MSIVKESEHCAWKANVCASSNTSSALQKCRWSCFFANIATPYRDNPFGQSITGIDNIIQAHFLPLSYIQNVYTICLTSEIEVFCHISSLENSIKNINCLPFSKLMNTMLLFWFLVAVFVNHFRLFLGFWKRKTCLTYDPWLTCNFPWDSKKAQKPSQVKSERKMD